VSQIIITNSVGGPNLELGSSNNWTFKYMLLLEIHLPFTLRPLSKVKLHLFFLSGNNAYVNFVKKCCYGIHLWLQFFLTSQITSTLWKVVAHDFLLAKVGLVRKHNLGLKPR
jgi:hypothetical protein